MLMDLAGVDYLHYGRDEWRDLGATRSGFSRAREARSAARPGARRALRGGLPPAVDHATTGGCGCACACADNEEPVVDR